MDGLDLGVAGVFVATFAIAIVSGLVPIVNGEIYLVGVVLAVGGGIPEAVTLGVLVGLGQMVAKTTLYHLARGATNVGHRRSKRFASGLEKARARVERWRSKPLTLTFISASVGLPPFYLVTLAAGILEVRFRAFFVVGLVGRVLRFSTIAVVAALA